MQTACDPFLGWTFNRWERFPGASIGRPQGRRRTIDLKGDALREYGVVCGEILAKGHARTGDAEEISGYCGQADKLDKAVAKSPSRTPSRPPAITKRC